MELRKEDFKELAAHEAAICISVYIPTHRSGAEVNEQQDAIMLKSKLQQVRGILTSKGKSPAAADAMLQQGLDLVNDREFWNRQENGLAVFIADNFFRYLKMPVAPKEDLIVNSSFQLVPLLDMIDTGGYFYLLVLSRHDAVFYQGDAFSMRKLEVEGLPNGMNDVIHYEEKSGQQLMRRSGAGAGRSASQSASFHGHGAGVADDTDYVLQYLKEVDQTLWTEVLSTANVPLLLAGVDYMVAHYKQVSKYNYIAGDYLQGNFEREDELPLYEKAKEKLMPYFREHTRKALKTYYDNTNTGGLSSFMPEDVIPASFYGRVSDLFIQKDEHIWGSFDHITNDLTIHENEQDGDSCLINKAAVKTIQHGGDVHILEKEKMPGDTRIAAFMRY